VAIISKWKLFASNAVARADHRWKHVFMRRVNHRRMSYSDLTFFSDRVSRESKAISSVCPSVCSSDHPFVSTLSFEPTELQTWVCVCMYVMTIPRLGLKVKVMGQGQSSMSSAYWRANAVTRSVWPRSSIDDSFSSFFHAAVHWLTPCFRSPMCASVHVSSVFDSLRTNKL